MSRLELLCKVHGVHGGTIHEYNEKYKCDFISMPEAEFLGYIQYIAYFVSWR